MKILKAALVVTAIAQASPSEARRETFAASIVRTTYGIPHITARSWSGAGYGVGYAYAQDNLCMIAEEFATVAGERSLHFGPKGTAVLGFGPVDNLTSDIYFRGVVDLPKLRAGVRRMDARSQALVTGYIAGYNRLLRDIGPNGVPEGCRGKAWVRPIGVDDMLRLNEKGMILAGSLAFAPFVAGAAPPKARRSALAPSHDPLPKPEDIRYGSNGWAFGGDVTRDGRGLLVGNPHFPWEGPSRFWQMHVTIPGQYDAMGASIAGAPIVTLGFNRDIAWTHTVTAAQHFTVFELKLASDDPLTYLVDGKRERMRETTVSVPMPDGTAPVQRKLYSTRYGPVIVSPFIGTVWNAEKAYALRDANAGNQRSLATWVDIGRARNVGDVRRAVSASLAIPWVNTIVADRSGNAMLADVTGVPGVSAAKIAACATPLSAKMAGRLVILDGSRSACDWTRTPGTAVAGLMPARDQAVIVRRDYVANSNDSYWLTNPKAPIAALSPILGSHATERSLRTRSGLFEIQRQLDSAGGGKIDAATARSTILASKSLAAEMVVDPLVSLCRTSSDLAEACEVLSRWDRRFEVDSRGAYLFATFWDAARTLPKLWAVPFDAADPVSTPRTLLTTGDNGAKLLAALRGAVEKAKKDGIALDARWGDVQFAVRGKDHIPIHGGNHPLGVLNMQRSKPVPGGLVPEHGTSYIQVVSFDAAGPVADALLSYSQSTDPASPHYADQTRAFSTKSWHRLPFTAAEVEQQKVGPVVQIAE